MTATPTPFLSIVVPAHQGADVLPRCLEAILGSTVPRESFELIVADDASTDHTALIAAQYADTVVRLAGNPHGPAYARNRAAEAARGDILVFVDADVLVAPEALARFAARFAADPDLCAVFGSYDADPETTSIVSQYRNLLHHYVHHMNAGPAETFWSGLGAIRRHAFIEMGMFDEWHYSRPQIEDIELGRRLRRAGHRILLDPTIQGKHLKIWTFGNMVKTDFKHRGVTWMWLMLREGPSQGPTSLNVRMSEKVCTAMTGVAGLSVIVALVAWALWPLGVALAAELVVILMNLGFYAYLTRLRGLRFGLAIIPLHLGFYVSNVLAVFSGWFAHALLGRPTPRAEAQALEQIGVKTWPPTPARPRAGIWTDEHSRPEPPEAGS